MRIDSDMDVYGIAEAIYSQQLTENNGSIEVDKYYWKVGERVAKQLRKIPLIHDASYETLFGIQIKFDIINPDNLQLFKDVTR